MLRAVGYALTLMLVSASALGQSPVPGGGQPAARPHSDQSDVGQIVRQIQHAARTLNYVGVFAFQQGERFESSRITHFFDGTVNVT